MNQIFAFEGFDGSGKTSIANKLSEILKIPIFHEPSHDEIYKEIANIAISNRKISPESAALLFTAGRLYSYNKNIEKALMHSSIIMDRYISSTIQYQISRQDNISISEYIELHQSLGMRLPNVVFFMKCKFDTCIARMKARGEVIDNTNHYYRLWSDVNQTVEMEKQLSEYEYHTIDTDQHDIDQCASIISGILYSKIQ